MAATANVSPAENIRVEKTDYPQVGAWFRGVFALLSTWFAGGGFLDGWAHFHGKVDSTFFTPWHAVLYSGFLLVGSFLALNQLRFMRGGYDWRRALPRGYGLSLVGAGIFAVAGVGDLVWHTLFGIEQAIEALLSPTHLALGIGLTLILTGPLRSAWTTPKPAGGWLRRWNWRMAPAVYCTTLALTVVTFLTGYTNPILNGYDANSHRLAVASSFSTAGVLIVSGILLHAALMMGVLLLLARRSTLPFGAVTLVFGLNTLVMAVFRDSYLFVPGAIAAGLAADGLYAWLKPSADHPGRMYVFAFAAPALFYAFYFLTARLNGRIGWSVHDWTGAIVLAGLIGALVNFLWTSANANAASGVTAP